MERNGHLERVVEVAYGANVVEVAVGIKDMSDTQTLGFKGLKYHVCVPPGVYYHAFFARVVPKEITVYLKRPYYKPPYSRVLKPYYIRTHPPPP